MSMEENLVNQKGVFRGKCNRSACLSEKDVTYYNHSTRKFYCHKCAILLNNVNDDLEAQFGHPLCTQKYPCHICQGIGKSPTHKDEPCCVCGGTGTED